MQLCLELIFTLNYYLHCRDNSWANSNWYVMLLWITCKHEIFRALGIYYWYIFLDKLRIFSPTMMCTEFQLKSQLNESMFKVNEILTIKIEATFKNNPIKSFKSLLYCESLSGINHTVWGTLSDMCWLLHCHWIFKCIHTNTTQPQY